MKKSLNNINNLNPQMTVHKHRHFLLSLDLLLPIVILVLGTILFRIFPWDMQFQTYLYDTHLGWWLGEAALFQFIYHYGNVFTLLIVAAALVIIAIGYSKQQYVKYRKLSLFFVLTLVLGPGLIVNSILKDNWGRPRPRNIIEFSGKYTYEKVLSIDPTSEGKSFPCGHATMGFFLFTPWFVLRKRKRILSFISLFLGITYGTLIGFVRMAQGGHFASDVLWAGVIVYVCAYCVFRILKLHKNLYYTSDKYDITKVKRNPIIYALWLLVPSLLFIVLLATPYQRTRTHTIDGESIQTIEVVIDKGDFHLLHGQNNQFEAFSTGFAFPGSKLKAVLKYSSTKDSLRITQSQKGIFTELQSTSLLTVSSLTPEYWIIQCSAGDNNVDLRTFPVFNKFVIEQKDGTLILSNSLIVSYDIVISGKAQVINNRPDIQTTKVEPNPLIKPVLVIKMTSGKIIIQ